MGQEGLTPQSVPLARPLTFCVLDFSRTTGWHGPVGNSTWEKAIDSTVHATARRMVIAKNIIIRKGGVKTLQERRAEQRWGREGGRRRAGRNRVPLMPARGLSPWPSKLQIQGLRRHQTQLFFVV